MTGEPLFDGFQRELAGPLQFAHFQIARDARFRFETTKSRHPAYLFRLSALDMARLGLLMARGGDWCGRRIVSRAWVGESTAQVSLTTRKTGYGYMWWTSDAGVQFRYSFQGRTFSARGARGQYIVVNPAEDLVIAHRVDTDDRSRRVRGRELAALLKAIMAARPGARVTLE
ncbi:MAG: serine hydrolase [Hyphomicrobiaceae bacterium]|nr:serine hydrolase [Hyphomicrobiaceae bacterium]